MDAFWPSILAFQSSISFCRLSAVSSAGAAAAPPLASGFEVSLAEGDEEVSGGADFNDKFSLVSTCELPALALRLARATSATVGPWVWATAETASAMTTVAIADKNLRFHFISISSSWSIRRFPRADG